MRSARVVTCLGLMLALACNDTGSGDGNGNGHDAGHAGGSSGATGGRGEAGSAPGAGASAGGAGASGSGSDGPQTRNGYPVADHCAPGTYRGMYLADCSGAEREVALNSGIGTDVGVRTSVYWHQLPEPMTAGEAYALSFEFDTYDGVPQLEVWGATSRCAMDGEDSELLDMQLLDRGRGVYCAALRPEKAFTHVLVVTRLFAEDDGYAQQGQTYCAAGACPGP